MDSRVVPLYGTPCPDCGLPARQVVIFADNLKVVHHARPDHLPAGVLPPTPCRIGPITQAVTQ
jgi:hypothetical protein